MESIFKYSPKETDPVPAPDEVACAPAVEGRGKIDTNGVDGPAILKHTEFGLTLDLDSGTSAGGTRLPAVAELCKWQGGVYPTTTDTACWNCAHTFLAQPVGIPVARTKEAEKSLGTWECIGNFCSFRCAYRYHLDTRRGDLTLLKQMHMESIARHSVGAINNIHLQAAPPRETLTFFGGELSIDQYRNLSDTHHVLVEGMQIIFPVTREFQDPSLQPDKPARKVNMLLRHVQM